MTVGQVSVQSIRVGVIGLGAIAQAVRLPLLRKRSDLFEVVGICDLSRPLAELVADRFGLPRAVCFDNLTELVERAEPAAILLLTSGSHGPLAQQALDRGLPVFVEKPLAYTMAEADALVAAANDRSAPLQLGYMKLYDPAVVEAQRVARNRPPPRAVVATVLRPSEEEQLAHVSMIIDPERRSTARRPAEGEAALVRRALGATAADELQQLYIDILLGSTVHQLSVVRFLAGAVADVEYVAVWSSGESPLPSVTIEAVLASGSRLAIHSHYLDRYPAYQEDVVLYYEDGSIAVRFPSPYLLHAPTVLTVEDRDRDRSRSTRSMSTAEAFELELVAFHAMVTAGAPVAADVHEGRADIATCQQIVRRYADQRGIDIGGEVGSR
jgi:myo-inositol 2-dehydrogenase / D-chiro-inositol 1-dehydrogenase